MSVDGTGGRRSSTRQSTAARGISPKARGERTRQRIAEAVIALIEAGEPTPTAKTVAARAKVSVRLVFHHFPDMNALYEAVMRTQFDRHWSGLAAVPSELPLPTRIERTVRQRARLFEGIAPVRRTGRALAEVQPVVDNRLAETRVLLRGFLQTTFAPEIGTERGRSGGDLLDALDVITSFDAWDRLRRHQGLSATAARRVTSRILSSLLTTG